MQLTKTLVVVAVAFAASASAVAVAPQGRSAALAARAVEIQAMVNTAGGEAKLAKRFGVPTIPGSGTPSPALAAIQAAIAEFQTELTAIEDLKENFEGNVEDATALFADIVETFTTLVAALSGAPLPEVPEVPEIPEVPAVPGVPAVPSVPIVTRSTALAARQGGLVGAIEALGENLQLILTQVQDFIGTVLSELGLGTVKNIVDGIFEPVLSLVETIKVSSLLCQLLHFADVLTLIALTTERPQRCCTWSLWHRRPHSSARLGHCCCSWHRPQLAWPGGASPRGPSCRPLNQSRKLISTFSSGLTRALGRSLLFLLHPSYSPLLTITSTYLLYPSICIHAPSSACSFESHACSPHRFALPQFALSCLI